MTLDRQVPALDVAGLTKRYGGTVALDDVSVSFDPGRIYGLVGINGLHSEALSVVFGPGKGLILVIALVVALVMPNTQAMMKRDQPRQRNPTSAPSR